MAHFKLNERLLGDCFQLGLLALCHVLLMDDAALPWLILVPETEVTELCDLDTQTHTNLFTEAHAIARLMRDHFPTDKLNVAAIGNIVSQLHVHVIARRRDDFCWPGVVWGRHSGTRYEPGEVARIRALMATRLGTRFRAHHDG